MKKLYILILLLVSPFLNAQIVTIPDVNFKNALIEAGVDTNNDGEIQVSEAEAVSVLNVSGEDISSLEGIQSFVNLEILYCDGNQLSALDMSQNPNLQELSCKFNQLSDLDMTQNPNLVFLWCYGNQLINLDVSQNINLVDLWCSSNLLGSLDVTRNIALESLYCTSNDLSDLDLSQNVNLELLACSDNQLSSLDLSQNSNLIGVDCWNNQLSSLDLSQNSNLIGVDCSNNQLNSLYIDNGNNVNMVIMISTENINLSCIQVDDENATYPECGGFPREGWCKDEWSFYSEDCSMGVMDIGNTEFSIYPNPAQNELFVVSNKRPEALSVKIITLEGKLLSTQNLELKNQIPIDVSVLSKGIYFLNVETENGSIIVKKFIKN